MVTNLDDPTVPIGCDPDVVAPTETVPESSFMRVLREELSSYATNIRKARVLRKEIEALSDGLKKKGELSSDDFSTINQLASAADRLDEAVKAIGSVESRLNLYAPTQFKSVLTEAPLRVSIEDANILVTAVDTGFGDGGRIKISLE